MSFSSFSQEKAPGEHAVIMANFKLPKTLGNKSFKGLMSGLATIDLIYQYNLANGIGFGTGFSYSYYELNGSVFQGSVLGQMEVYNPFLKISQRKEMNENESRRSNRSKSAPKQPKMAQNLTHSGATSNFRPF